MKTLRISLLGSGQGPIPGFLLSAGSSRAAAERAQSRMNEHPFVKLMTAEQDFSVSPRLAITEKLVSLLHKFRRPPLCSGLQIKSN
jgi:hypothetical protein